MARADKVEEVKTSGPRAPVIESVRVDKVRRGTRAIKSLRAIIAVVITVIMLIPVGWMILTAFKSHPDAIAVPPKLIFEPRPLDSFVFLFTDRFLMNRGMLNRYPEECRQSWTECLANECADPTSGEKLTWYECVALESGQMVTGPGKYVEYVRNSVIIAGLSTLAAVVLGLFAGYAYSRFEFPVKDFQLFFILSQRFLPAVVIVIPIFLMYTDLGLHDTHLGMIILYTVVNLSLSVWLLRSFVDEIPPQYEEAAMVDGYSRLQAIRKIVLPNALTGIAATTVFCLIFAWNEYGFALMLTSDTARTAPAYIPSMIGRGIVEWTAIAAGSLIFLIPVVIVTFALRKYLLRGVTFGAIRQ
jgi:multiple sugar transport system permease protein